MITKKAAGEREKLREFVIAGRTRQDMADELGISYDGVRAKLRRANLTATHQFDRTVRERAEDMPLKEGFDYLLGVLEAATDCMTGNDYHPVDDLKIPFSGTERRVMIVLWESNGGIVSKEKIIKAMYLLDYDYDKGSNEMVWVYLCRIRKKLKDTKYYLENLHGEGWRLKESKDDE